MQAVLAREVWASVVNECGCPVRVTCAVCPCPLGKGNDVTQEYKPHIVVIPRADTSRELSVEPCTELSVPRASSAERVLLVPEPGKPVVARFALEMLLVIRPLGLRARPRLAVVLGVGARAHARLLPAVGLGF